MIYARGRYPNRTDAAAGFAMSHTGVCRILLRKGTPVTESATIARLTDNSDHQSRLRTPCKVSLLQACRTHAHAPLCTIAAKDLRDVQGQTGKDHADETDRETRPR